MDLFSIIWLIVAIGFIALPAAIDKKLKNAGRQGQNLPGGNNRKSFNQGKWPIPSISPQNRHVIKKYTGKEEAIQDEDFVRQRKSVNNSPMQEGVKNIAKASETSTELPLEAKSASNQIKNNQKISSGKFIINSKDMIIYSSLMNPKFKEF
ncbi:MAG: hypothetical protein ACTTK1_07930 [Candidatus Cryptobacteroides sp.]